MLDSIEDVTARVNAAVPPEIAGDPDASFKARRKAIADIEKESQDKTQLRSNVITLWQGGAYHLYRFKRFTDVRLVFAPEKAVAAFGGDPDNFEYPRYDLDFSSSAFTKTASPTTRRISSSGPPTAPRKATSPSSSVIPAPPAVS